MLLQNASGSWTETGDQTLTVTLPAPATAGHLLIAFAAAAAWSPDCTMAAPTGWLWGPGTGASGSDWRTVFWSWMKVASGGEQVIDIPIATPGWFYAMAIAGEYDEGGITGMDVGLAWSSVKYPVWSPRYVELGRAGVSTYTTTAATTLVVSAVFDDWVAGLWDADELVARVNVTHPNQKSLAMGDAAFLPGQHPVIWAGDTDGDGGRLYGLMLAFPFSSGGGEPPIIKTTMLPTAYVGVLLTHYDAFGSVVAGWELLATGYAVKTWTITAGSLPPGVSMTSAGVLLGTPTTAGSYAFTVNCANLYGSDSQALTWLIAEAPAIPAFAHTPDNMAFVIDTPSDYTVIAEVGGMPAPIVYSTVSGAWPTGVTLAADGSVVGIPTGPLPVPRSGSIVAQAAAAGGTASKTINWILTEAAIEEMARGNIDWAQLKAASRHGTGAKGQAFTGSSTPGHVAVFDGDGNLVDGGTPAPGGGTGVTESDVVGLVSDLSTIRTDVSNLQADDVNADWTAVSGKAEILHKPTSLAVWGSITGTLSGQTDLQGALDAKLDDSQLDTDGALAANSDAKIPSQKAVVTYVGAHAGAGTVTHTAGALTLNLPVLGAGSADVKIGTADQLVPTLPADATKYLDGTGAFSTPTGTGASMVYPASGVPQSTGSAWGSSLALDTDGALAANSDTKLATQKATKTYVDAHAGTGTVTHTAGALTVNLPVLGAGAADVKIGTAAQLVPTLPADATKYLDGTGAFSTPPGTVYPAAGVPQSTGSAWGSSLAFDTDGALAANSDAKVASQKAVKTYVDAHGAGTAAADETPSGTKNSVNATFTLAHAPLSGTLILCVNGVQQRRGTDYAASGSTLTMIVAPRSYDSILAMYRY